MPRGPLPKPESNRRRTNAPVIPTTNLPLSGRPGRAPALPPGATLGKVGKAYWAWAWKTPQAMAWSPGHEPVVARRASLEDDLAALADVQGLDLSEHMEDPALAERIQGLVKRLAALSAGRLQLVKEMRELDDRLGLTPKSMAQLRWTIVDSEAAGPALPAGVGAPVAAASTPVQRKAAERWGRPASSG